jgi:hypothetical protein
LRCFERGRPLRLSRIPVVDLARVKIRPEILERWAYRGGIDPGRLLLVRALVMASVSAEVERYVEET